MEKILEELREAQRFFKTECDESDGRSTEHVVSAGWRMYHTIDKAILALTNITD